MSGSLQARSSNTRLLHFAKALAGPGVEVDILDGLDQLPYFNPDHDRDPVQVGVAHLRARLTAADALLIASPEYAHEMPGVLKNALDWLVSSGELYGKRVGILCAAPHAQRGRYVRQALEQTLRAQGADVVLSHTVAVPPGTNIDEPTADVRQVLVGVLETLASAQVHSST